jgi:energy-converting hydrogenase Eha subunit E
MTTKTESAAATSSRTESFKQEVAVLKIKDPNAGRDTPLMYTGAALMVLGIVISVIGYFVSHGTSSPLTQNDAVTIAIIGIPISVAGAALFLRYSMGTFLRFWLARFIFEAKNRD